MRVAEETEAVGRLWGRFVSRAPGISRRTEPLVFTQLATWTEESEDWLDIMVGARMETLDRLEIDLIGKVVPACDCLVFEHAGDPWADDYRFRISVPLS
ncbi:MAG: hypothetical protein WCT14_20255 [Treponemataceae bacterium]